MKTTWFHLTNKMHAKNRPTPNNDGDNFVEVSSYPYVPGAYLLYTEMLKTTGSL